MSEFQLRKLKITKSAGVEILYNDLLERNDTIIPTEHGVKCKKDEPHPDLKAALSALEDIVRYDEGYSKKVDVEVTGVTYFPSNEAWIITHVKSKVSGRTATNSGRISANSEEFSKIDEMQAHWDVIVEEVRKYLFEGKRAQLSIAFGSEDEEVEEVEHAQAV